MKRPATPSKWISRVLPPAVLLALAGCSATPQTLVSDAYRPLPPLTVVQADGFIVGDALGMALFEGFGVRLADVNEPFVFAD